AGCGTPAFSYSGVSAHKPERPEVRDALVVAIGNAIVLHAQKFPAPDRTVDSIPSAIPGDPKIRPLHVVVGRARGHMGVMMLDANQRESRFLGPLCRCIIGVQIACDGLGCEAVKAAKIVDSAFESIPRFQGFEISNMLAEENILPNADGDGVF